MWPWTQPKFTMDDISDLSGKVIIITGGTNGLGLKSVIHLARHHAHVIITARTPEKGEMTVSIIRSRISKLNKDDHYDASQYKIEYGIMEQDLKSVQEFTTWFQNKQIPLDIFMLNAGISGICIIELMKL